MRVLKGKSDLSSIDVTTKKQIKQPVIDVVIVRNNPDNNYFLSCLGSVQSQNYSRIGIIQIYNFGKLRSDEIIQEALDITSAEWILFVHELDFISSDYVHSAVSFLEFCEKTFNQAAHRIGSCITNVDKDNRIINHEMVSPVGLWNVEALRHNKGNITKYLSLLLSGKQLPEEKIPSIFMDWHYGYYNRKL